MAGSSPLTEMRRICLALPEATETMTWGQPHFRVRGKIFAGCGDHGGTLTLGFKLEREHADAAIQDPRFTRAPYVGQHGWISMDVKGVRDWKEVRALVMRELSADRTEGAVGGRAGRKAKVPARRKSRARSGASRTRRRPAATRR